jgi:hypothetical protein
MPKIFICYRRDDSIETAGRIYSWLDMRLPEGDVFLDVDTISPGTNFRSAISNALATDVQVVLVIIGRNWIETPTGSGGVHRRLEDQDDQVRQEIEAAFQHGKTIIPVLVQGAKAPRREDLPASIVGLADINALAVRPQPDFDDDMRRLRQAILSHSPGFAFHMPISRSSVSAWDLMVLGYLQRVHRVWGRITHVIRK